MMRSLCILACAALAAGCATDAQTSENAVYDATFSDAPDNATRDMIRTYVRDIIGPDYIVDIDALTRSNMMVAVDRGRGQVAGRPIPKPDVTFQLELADTYEGPVCRLVPQDKQHDAPALLLPPEVRCQLLPSQD